MSSFIVDGGKTLHGVITNQAAKNSILPIIACCILTSEKVVIKNCPRLNDIDAMAEIIRRMGGEAYFDDSNLVVICKDVVPRVVDFELTGKIRSSVFVLGPIISRFRHASVCYPGGCEIGLRPIDLHIGGLSALNAAIDDGGNIITCDGSALTAGAVSLDFPSVGATENIMMAAVLLDGITTIINAAREPEIIDLQEFINKIGGKVSGAGTSTITIEGVKKLKGGVFTPMPDRITAGTYLTACAITGGDLTVNNVRPAHIIAITDKLSKAGCDVDVYDTKVRLKMKGRAKGISKLETNVYPGFPTDMQAVFCAMLAGASGSSVVVENLFENRFKYTQELKKMGANITVKDRVAIVRGVKSLHSANMCAKDLRGGAALVLAALGVEGRSVIDGAHHIDRGYENIESVLCSVGATVIRK